MVLTDKLANLAELVTELDRQSNELGTDEHRRIAKGNPRRRPGGDAITIQT